MSNVSNQLYVMGYAYDAINHKKIGISGKGNSDAQKRVRELNSSKSGTLHAFECYVVRAWDLFRNGKPVSAYNVEQYLQGMFKKMTDFHERGEWFEDDERNGDSLVISTVVDTLSMLSVYGITAREVDFNQLDKETQVSNDVKEYREINKIRFSDGMFAEVVVHDVIRGQQYTSMELAKLCVSRFPELHNKGNKHANGVEQVRNEIGSRIYTNSYDRILKNNDISYDTVQQGRKKKYIFLKCSGAIDDTGTILNQ